MLFLQKSARRFPLALLHGILALIFATCIFPLSVSAGPGDPGMPELSGAHISTTRLGTLQTKDGLTLKVKTDLGNIRIVRLEPGAPPSVHYTVRIETDAKPPLAQKLLEHYSMKESGSSAGVELVGNLPPEMARGNINAQFWIQFEISVPASYSVDINTGGGDIETQDIGGIASLVTQGGNIRTGRIGGNKMRNVSTAGRPVAKLQTGGGHIQVLDVSGDLNAFTAGGHINVGKISGDATLRTGGGHIRAEQIGGRSDLSTEGGNVTVGHAKSFVNVRTAGGQIDFGEVRGSVRAQTGGGGVRILYVTGPMEVESNGGSICLTHVSGTIQAATGVGTITAWISPDASSGDMVHLAGASQLTSVEGDIIVFVPRNLAATIDASVSSGNERRIEADPALNLSVQSALNNGTPWAKGTVALNGGGPLLKLRTTSGKIRLEFIDSQTALRESLIREQQDRINGRMKDVSIPQPQFTPTPDANSAPDSQTQNQGDWLENWMDQLEKYFNGGLREDPADFQKRLVYSPHPSYPDLAKRSGIQGMVVLQVRVTKDGRVEVLKLIQGEPVLADSAIATVKQWRAKPVWSNGKPMEVISTVTFNFQLQ